MEGCITNPYINTTVVVVAARIQSHTGQNQTACAFAVAAVVAVQLCSLLS
eukprot:m.111616 g.111616  ORF g.111616 m.111616 type:complete len:50 (+) comp28133_c0_seq3:399-548(+)